MAISDKMAKALNGQVKNEFFSYWAYLSMSFALDKMGMKIFSKWFHQQAIEEQEHAMKMCNYLMDQSAPLKLQPLEAPQSEYNSVEEVVQAALDHEKVITQNINDLVDIALAEKDHPTNSFLQWFVAEQVEEVATVTELLDMVKMSSGSGQLLMLEDRIMSLRAPKGESA